MPQGNNEIVLSDSELLDWLEENRNSHVSPSLLGFGVHRTDIDRLYYAKTIRQAIFNAKEGVNPLVPHYALPEGCGLRGTVSESEVERIGIKLKEKASYGLALERAEEEEADNGNRGSYED